MSTPTEVLFRESEMSMSVSRSLARERDRGRGAGAGAGLGGLTLATPISLLLAEAQIITKQTLIRTMINPTVVSDDLALDSGSLDGLGLRGRRRRGRRRARRRRTAPLPINDTGANPLPVNLLRRPRPRPLNVPDPRRRRPTPLDAGLADDALPLDVSGAGPLVLVLVAVRALRAHAPRAVDELRRRRVAHGAGAPVVAVDGLDLAAAEDDGPGLGVTLLAEPGRRCALLPPRRAARDDAAAEVLLELGDGAPRRRVVVALLELGDAGAS